MRTFSNVPPLLGRVSGPRIRQVEFKKEKIDWVERQKQLDVVVENHRGKGIYDCVVPYSGGKDSVYQLWYIVKVLNLKDGSQCILLIL